MRARAKTSGPDGRLTGVEGVMVRYNVGRNTALRIGKEAGALVKIGRLSRYDLDKIDAYIDTLMPKGN